MDNLILSESLLAPLAAIGPVLKGAVVFVDDGCGKTLQSLGGSELLFEQFHVATVMPFEPQDNAERLIREWENSILDNCNPSRQKKYVFLLSHFLAGLETSIASILSQQQQCLDVKTTAYIFCSVSPQAHESCLSLSSSTFDYDTFGRKVLELLASKDVDVQVKHLPLNFKLHMNPSPLRKNFLGVFSLANERLSNFYPVTLNRYGLQHRGDIADLDCNADLPDDAKSDMKLIAHTLASTLLEDLKLDATDSCWTTGITSRLIGNIFVASSRENRIKNGVANARKCHLILMDRSIDLVTSLRRADLPISQRLFNCDSDDMINNRSKEKPVWESKEELDRKLGHGMVEQLLCTNTNALVDPMTFRTDSSAAQAVFREIGLDLQKIIGKDYLERLNVLIEKDPEYWKKLDLYQLAAACCRMLALEVEHGQLLALEKIILQGYDNDVSSAILPLVDAVNKGKTSLEDIVCLALLAYSFLGSCKSRSDQKSSAALFETFEDSLKHAIIRMASKDRWKAISCKSEDHICRVLREQLESQQNYNPDIDVPGDPVLSGLILRGISHMPSRLSLAGEGLLEKTAKDLGNMLTQGLKIFGIGTPLTGGKQIRGEDQEPGKDHQTYNKKSFSLNDGDTCIIFTLGGITFTEIKEVISIVEKSGRNVRFLFGGTCIASPSMGVYRSFQMLRKPSVPSSKPPHAVNGEAKEKEDFSHLFSSM